MIHQVLNLMMIPLVIPLVLTQQVMVLMMTPLVVCLASFLMFLLRNPAFHQSNYHLLGNLSQYRLLSRNRQEPWLVMGGTNGNQPNTPPRNHSLVRVMGSIKLLKQLNKRHNIISFPFIRSITSKEFTQSCQVTIQQLSILSNLAIYLQLKYSSHHLEILNVFVNNTTHGFTNSC